MCLKLLFCSNLGRSALIELFFTEDLIVVQVRTIQYFTEYEQFSFLYHILYYRYNDTKFAFCHEWFRNKCFIKYTKFCMVITGTKISYQVKQL